MAKNKGFKNSGKVKTFGIIGLGRFGSALAKELSNAGYEVLALDKNEEKIREIRQYTDQALVVSSLDVNTLREAGVDSCDTVIVCIGERVDVSILATLHVKQLLGQDRRVISKATSEDHGEVLQTIGAEVVYPERDMAVRVAKKLVSTSVLDYISLNDEIEIYEIQVGPRLNGKTIKEIDFRKRFGLNIIAIEKGNTTQIEINPEDVLSENDTIAVIGKRYNIVKFHNYLCGA